MKGNTLEVKWLKCIAVISALILVAVAVSGLFPAFGATNPPNTTGSSSVIAPVESGNGIQKITSLEDLKPGALRAHLQPNGRLSGMDSAHNYRNGNYIKTSGNGTTNRESGDTLKRNGCMVPTSVPISLKHSWKLKYKYYCSQPYNSKTRANVVDVMLNGANSSGNLQIRFSIGAHKPNSSTARTQYIIYSKGGTFLSKTKTIGTECLDTTKSCELTYDASTKKFKVSTGGYVYEVASPFTSDTFTFTFGGTAYFTYNVSIIDPVDTAFTFTSFEYTDYGLQIASTNFYDLQGRKITGPVGRIQDVIVEVKVKSNSPAPFPARLMLEPVSGARIQPREGIMQSALVNGSVVGYNASTCDINNSAVGIPFTAVNGETTIRYRAYTSNTVDPAGTNLVLKHKVVDSYFYNNSALPAGWTSAFPLNAQYNHAKERLLTSDFQNKTAHDYKHNVSPNSHGWYNQNVTLTRSDTLKDFQELYYSPGGDYTCSSGSFTISKETETKDAADGSPYWIYGRNTTTNGLSGLIVEYFKIDKTAPYINTVSRTARTFKINDALSGVEYVKVKKPGDTAFTAFKTYTAATGGIGKNTDTVQFPAFPEIKDEKGNTTGTLLGTYSYCITDMAGNTSAVTTLTNTAPVVSAKKTSQVLKYSDIKSGFSPTSEFQTTVADKEETIPVTRLKWKIEKASDATFPAQFEPVEGTGANNTVKALPVGKYQITFSMDGRDSDGNSANTQTTALTVNADLPPVAHDNENDFKVVEPNSEPIIDRLTGVQHSSAEASYVVFVADVQERYGKEIDKNEAISEVKRLYSFTSVNMPFTKESLEIRKNGVDITSSGIDTTKEGKYSLVFRAEDSSGSSITLNVNYQIQEDCYITFDPGKGTFANKDLTRTEKVKVGEKLNESQIPPKEDLEAPVEKTFIGWGKRPDSTDIENITSETVNNNITYYALYVTDLNRDGVDDREQALFQFKTSDPNKGAFKDTDRLIVGETITEGNSGRLSPEKIPELLFERGYSLKGFSTNDNDGVLTVKQLCEKECIKGSILTCTAEFNYTTPVGDTDVYVTFFSEYPNEAPLTGGDGQKLHKTATATAPVYLSEEDIPQADLSPGYKFIGWRTNENEADIISTELLCGRELYGGDNLTCIACFEYDPNAIDREVQFTFFSNDPANASFSQGEGFRITKVSQNGQKQSLDESSIPELNLNEGYQLSGWKTDETGDTLLTTEQLCSLERSGDTELTCIAYTKNTVVNGGNSNKEPDKDKPETPGGKEDDNKDKDHNKDKDQNKGNENKGNENNGNENNGNKVNNDKDPSNTPQTDKERDTETNQTTVTRTKTETIESSAEKAGSSAIFAFFSEDTSKGTVAGGEGRLAVVSLNGQKMAGLHKNQIPAVRSKTGFIFAYWTTSATGDRHLSTSQLLKLEAKAGAVINCTAHFEKVKVSMVRLKDDQTTTDGKKRTSLTTIGEGEAKVPLGGAPSGLWKNRGFAAAQSCITHLIMLLWLAIAAVTAFYRIHRRKRSEFGWYSDSSDYLFLAGTAAAGFVLTWTGKCILEYFIMAAGLAVLTYYLVRIKMLDHKLAKLEKTTGTEE